MHSWCIIPDNVLQDDRLTANAKILYGKIIGSSSRRGFCVSTNSEFSDELGGVNERTVQRYVKELSDCRYILTRQENGDRRIYITLQGDGGPADVEVEDNGQPTPMFEFTTHSIFNFWNDELRKAHEEYNLPFRARKKTQARLKVIATRLKDGYSSEDLKNAIRGCVWNEYNLTNGYTDITLILRNPQKVDMNMGRWNGIKREREREEGKRIAEYTG